MSSGRLTFDVTGHAPSRLQILDARSRTTSLFFKTIAAFGIFYVAASIFYYFSDVQISALAFSMFYLFILAALIVVVGVFDTRFGSLFDAPLRDAAEFSQLLLSGPLPDHVSRYLASLPEADRDFLVIAELELLSNEVKKWRFDAWLRGVMDSDIKEHHQL